MSTPTIEQIRTLEGRPVRVRLTEPGGGGQVDGVLVGTLDAADGMVVFIESPRAPGRRLSYNYQHLLSIEPA